MTIWSRYHESQDAWLVGGKYAARVIREGGNLYVVIPFHGDLELHEDEVLSRRTLTHP